MNEAEFSFQNMPESWMLHEWRSIRDYAERYPIYLAISKNRRPCDVGLILIGDVGPPTWDTSCTQSLTVPYRISTHGGLPCHEPGADESTQRSAESADEEFLRMVDG